MENKKSVSVFLCDRRSSLRVKGKVYKTTVRPALIWGREESAREEVGCRVNLNLNAVQFYPALVISLHSYLTSRSWTAW